MCHNDSTHTGLRGVGEQTNFTPCNNVNINPINIARHNIILMIITRLCGYPCSISELRDYYGCIMFDEYEVGLLVRDLTKIVALRPGEEDSHSPSCCTPV